MGTGAILFSSTLGYNGAAVLKKLKEKLVKTRVSLKETIENLVSTGKNRDEILEDLMETLILADVGVVTSEKIIAAVRRESQKNDPFETLLRLLKKEIIHTVKKAAPVFQDYPSASVWMFVGVNGGGKTTSIAKMAYSFQRQEKEVLLVAADTFRAAAQEQLSLWGKRLNIPVIKGQYGADPASVVYDAIQSFKAHRKNCLFIDTAGRIHTNINLMNELEKIKRIIAREIEGAPHEILLVLDASIGQNALVQAKEFLKFSGLSGIFLTKLDGSAKGGSVIGIADELDIPIKYVGIGESEMDMLPFSPEEFVEALFS
jgi:fused signal recognition particle receptor